LATIEITSFTPGSSSPLRDLFRGISGRHPDDASGLSLDARRHELDARRIDPAIGEVQDKAAIEFQSRHFGAKVVGQRRGRLIMVFDDECAHAALARHPHIRDAALPVERAGGPGIHVKVQVARSLEQASAIGFATRLGGSNQGICQEGCHPRDQSDPQTATVPRAAHCKILPGLWLCPKRLVSAY
jgi:hypothetical protein